MHSSYSNIFSILQYSLFPSVHDSEEVSQDADWSFIYQEMQDQTVSALAFPWLEKHAIPDPELQQKWMTSCLQQQAKWMQIMYEQTQLINLMEQNNIPCVIIKGSAAMMSYPHPRFRTAGDIDFLVKRTDFDEATRILIDNNYTPGSDLDIGKHHISFAKNNISFELHQRLAIINETDERLLSLFEDGIENRVWHTIVDNRFPSLPDDLNGLVLLFHINQHLREGIGLRQIIDWMMYIYKYNNLNDILPVIRTTGMEKLAITVTIMCQKYLGLPSLIEESDEYPYDELMEYIITSGNFGKKKDEEEKTATVLLKIANPLLFFRRLQKGGLRRWETAEKYRILRPFAWIYQIGFYIRMLFTDKNTSKTVTKSRKKATNQLNLIHKLGLDVDKSIKKHKNC